MDNLTEDTTNQLNDINQLVIESRFDLLNTFYALKEYIFNKYKTNEKTTIYEIYLYKFSECLISILRNDYFTKQMPLSQIYTYTIMIESFVIMSLYKDNNEDLYELYASYDIYVDYNNIATKEDKEKALNYIKDKNIANLIKNNQDEYIKQIKEKLPFLLDDFSFEDVIEKKYYYLLSPYLQYKLMTEPLSNTFKNHNGMPENLQSSKLLMVSTLLKEVLDDIGDIDVEEKEYTLKLNNYYNKKYISIIDDINRNLEQIAREAKDIKCLTEFRETILNLIDSIKDIAYDGIYNQNALATNKQKILIETIGLNNQILEFNKLTTDVMEYYQLKSTLFTNLYTLNKLKKLDIKDDYYTNEFKKLEQKYLEKFCDENSNIDYNNPINFLMEDNNIHNTIDDYIAIFINDSLKNGYDFTHVFGQYKNLKKLEKIKVYYYQDEDSTSNSKNLPFVGYSLILGLINNYLNAFIKNNIFDNNPELQNYCSHISRYMDKIYSYISQGYKLITKL